MFDLKNEDKDAIRSGVTIIRGWWNKEQQLKNLAKSLHKWEGKDELYKQWCRATTHPYTWWESTDEDFAKLILQLAKSRLQYISDNHWKRGLDKGLQKKLGSCRTRDGALVIRVKDTLTAAEEKEVLLAAAARKVCSGYEYCETIKLQYIIPQC